MRSSTRRDFAIRLVGSLLALAVAVIHVIDQGGFPGHKSPGYVGVGYYLLEAAGVIVVALLLGGRRWPGWFLSLGVAAGPAVGYVVAHGPGLPGSGNDKDSWTAPLGVISLVVEGVLLALAAVQFARRTSAAGDAYPQEDYAASARAATRSSRANWSRKSSRSS